MIRIIIIIAIILFSCESNVQREDKSEQVYKVLYYETKQSLLSSWQMHNEILDSIKFVDDKNNICNISDIVNDSTVICYISYRMCQPCIEKFLEHLNKFDINTRVKFIISSPELSEFYYVKLIKNKQNIYYRKKEIFTNVNSPLLFTMDSNRIDKFLESPKNTHDLVNLFFEEVGIK